jgi:hypothetical protein
MQCWGFCHWRRWWMLQRESGEAGGRGAGCRQQAGGMPREPLPLPLQYTGRTPAPSCSSATCAFLSRFLSRGGAPAAPKTLWGAAAALLVGHWGSPPGAGAVPVSGQGGQAGLQCNSGRGRRPSHHPQLVSSGGGTWPGAVVCALCHCVLHCMCWTAGVTVAEVVAARTLVWCSAITCLVAALGRDVATAAGVTTHVWRRACQRACRHWAGLPSSWSLHA